MVKNREKQGISYLYSMNQLLLIFIGGGLGSLTRFSLSKFIQENIDKTFPFGTLGVNVLASLVFGAQFYLILNLYQSESARGLSK